LCADSVNDPVSSGPASRSPNDSRRGITGDADTTEKDDKSTQDTLEAVSVGMLTQTPQKAAASPFTDSGPTAAKSDAPTPPITARQLFYGSGDYAARENVDVTRMSRSSVTLPSVARRGSKAFRHRKLFSSELFTTEDWKKHTSYRRWLPEPMALCVSSLEPLTTP
jgi:hypothetical protein